MKTYYNHMNTYHISYAANPGTKKAVMDFPFGRKSTRCPRGRIFVFNGCKTRMLFKKKMKTRTHLKKIVRARLGEV
jgi:hypothetical protein